MSTERDNLPVILSNLAHYDAMIKGYIKNRQDEMAPLKHTHVKSEVGLSNVDNTADKNKSVASATKWTTPMTLTVTGAMNGSMSFDGSTASTLKLTEGDVSFKNSLTMITGSADWNLIITPGCYNVNNMGDYATYHTPKQYSTNINDQGLLLVFKTALANVSANQNNRVEYYKTIQIYFPIPGSKLHTIVTRMLSSADVSTGDYIWTEWKSLSADIANEMYPGLVKSGGDVTISEDGLISVNDDSHNHVIGNIDGLQELLDTFEANGSADGAYAKAVSYTDSKIADLINSAPATLDTLKELADAITSNQEVIDVLNSAITEKLPLAGGTMNTNATIIFPNGAGMSSSMINSSKLQFTAASGDGWARGISYYSNDGTIGLGSIGAFGTGDSLDYFYIGSRWDTAKVKIYNDGNTKAEKFTVKDKVELDYNSTTDSLTLNFL